MASKKRSSGKSAPARKPARAHHRATVLLDDESTAATTRKLRDEGFKVESKLDAVGALTGTVPADKLETIRAIKGVKAVEVERTYQLPPPDSDVQ